MRILHVINNLGAGGAEKLVCDVASLMKTNGHHVEVLLLQKHGSIYIDDLLSKDIQVNILSRKQLYDLRHIYRIHKFIKQRKFDIVHAHIFPTLYFVSLASLFTSSKYIFTEHSTTNKRMKNKLFQLLDNIIYRQYHSIICITDSVREKIKEHLNWLQPRCIVISNGIDLNKYKCINTLNKNSLYSGYQDDHKIICMVGRFSYEKDHITLIKTMSYLPQNVHLLLVGDGPLKNDIINLINQLGLDNRIHLLGIRRDVPDILRLCDAGVLSSNWEGFGLAAVEVMAAGRPVIASNVDGLASVVRGAGLLFEKGNCLELSQYLEKLFSDNEYYCNISRMCLLRAKEYSIDKMISRYILEYQTLL